MSPSPPTDPRRWFAGAALLLATSLAAQNDPYAPVWAHQHRSGATGPAMTSPATPVVADPVYPAAVSVAASPLPLADSGYTPAEVRALDESVPLEHQRYLLYLYAKVGRDDMAEPLARRVLARMPDDRDSLLAMTVMYVEKQRADQALAYASALYRLFPTDREAAYYYGMANFLAGNYAESTRILQALRLREYQHKPFPYNVDLAQAALRAGNWHQSILAYREFLDQNPVSDELRREVRMVLDQLYHRHLSKLEAAGNAYLLSNGQFQQYLLNGEHQVGRRTRIFAHLEHNQIQVKPSLTLQDRWNDANEAWAGLSYEVRPNATLSAWAGGANVGAQGGARLRYLFQEKGETALEVFAHEKARDGLLLQSLDGRQHRVSLSGSWYLRPRLLVYGQLAARQIVVDGHELGRGLNGSWNAEFFLRQDITTFRLGYRGIASTFGRQSDATGILTPAVQSTLAPGARVAVLDELVLNHIHREGIYADWLVRLLGPVFLHLNGGLDYALERDSMVYYTRFGLVIYPRRSLEFVSELGYTSSVANANAGSGQWEINVALRYWF